MPASGIRVIDDRDEYHNNSDGFGGGDGSVIENSYFDTWDDTFKIYNGDLTVRNTTVLHNGNGAPVQMAGGDYGHGTLIADGLKVVSHSRNHYNQGVFSWAGGTKSDSPTVKLTGRGLIRSTPAGMRTGPLYVWNGYDLPFSPRRIIACAPPGVPAEQPPLVDSGTGSCR
ncbi:hypothetical protein ACIQXA_04725 [Streptomyces massasporeus]|uniref:hypothetical protein n=1 Tax=Streptomyces massasporeus TaxID=67324 RepID=UPI0037F811CE